MFRPPSFGSQPTNTNIFGTPAQPPQAAPSLFGQTVPPSPFGAMSTSFTSHPMNQAAGASSSSGMGMGMGGMSMAGRSGTSNPPYQITRELESDMQVNFKAICAMPAYSMKSYEELRLEDYACGRKGPTNPFQSSLQGGFGSSSAGGQSLLGKPSTFGGFGGPTPSASSTIGAPFGSFGQQVSAPSSAQPSTLMFGGQPSAGSSLFGGQSSTMFGQPQPTAPTSSFGASTTSAFGQPSAVSQPFGAFGSNAGNMATTAPPTSSLFGQSQTSTFGGGSLFGAPPPPPSSTTAPQASGSGLFGGGFGMSQPQQQQQQQQSTTSLFGGTSTAQKPLFGSMTTQPAAAMPQQSFNPPMSTSFGQPQPASTQPTSLLFGQAGSSTAQPSYTAPSGGAFSGQTFAPTTSLFGTTSQQQPQPASLFSSKPLFAVATAPTTQQQQPFSGGFGGGMGGGAGAGAGGAGGISGMSGMSGMPASNSLGGLGGSGSLFGSSGNLAGGLGASMALNQQPPPSSLTSIAPPLPSALANIQLKPASASSQLETPKAKPVATGGHGSSWRIKLRESGGETLREPAEPLLHQQQSAQAKPAVLVPRRFKSLVVESAAPPAMPPAPASVKQSASTHPADAPGRPESKQQDRPQHGDFFTSPPESVLKKYTEQQLKSVNGFVVGQRGVGQIRFLKPVDLSDIHLDNLFTDYIAFAPNQVVVYPDVARKAPPGSGLNQPAEIMLERCWPVSRSTRLPITDPENERFKQHMNRLKSLEGTDFVDFVNETGTWVFKVDHFSGYGVPEEYREVDDCDDDGGVGGGGHASGTGEEGRIDVSVVDFSSRPVDNRWQATFRTSIDCFGRLAVCKGPIATLVPVDEEEQACDPQLASSLIKNPRNNPDIALLLNVHQDRTGWLAEAVKRWCPDACARSGLHCALFTGNMVQAEREAARVNRPWLAALLASSECPGQSTAVVAAGDDCSMDGQSEVSRLCLSLLSGKVDGVADEYSTKNPWLLDYALRVFYLKRAPGGEHVVAETLPNRRPIPDVLSSILLQKQPVLHKDAFQFRIDGVPDMLVPFLVGRELGIADASLTARCAEQLQHAGLVQQAAMVAEDHQCMLLDLHARFPHVVSSSLRFRSMAAAWRFKAEHDHEAEFDAWVAAGCLDQAVLVFVECLSDRYVLGGEHGRLAARLSALQGFADSNVFMHIYDTYLKMRVGQKDASLARDLAAQMDTVEVNGNLRKRIAFAEMAAACIPHVCKYLPPELFLLACHRILE